MNVEQPIIAAQAHTLIWEDNEDLAYVALANRLERTPPYVSIYEYNPDTNEAVQRPYRVGDGTPGTVVAVLKDGSEGTDAMVYMSFPDPEAIRLITENAGSDAIPDPYYGPMVWVPVFLGFPLWDPMTGSYYTPNLDKFVPTWTDAQQMG